MDGIPPIINNPNFFNKTLRMLPVQKRGRAGPKITFNGGFACEVSVNVWKDISMGKKKQAEAQTLENEGASRLPDVEYPTPSRKVEIYSARAISGYKNIIRQRLIDNTPSPERPLIIVRRLGKIFVEVGVLRESKTSLVLEMAKVPKDLGQIGCIGFVTECLWYRCQTL